MTSTKTPSFDVWVEYNYKMKLLKQHENDNFIRAPKKKAVRLVSSKQLEMAV